MRPSLHSAYDQLSNYYADQVQLQQQEADRIAKAKKEDLERFRQENQVGSDRRAVGGAVAGREEMKKRAYESDE